MKKRAPILTGMMLGFMLLITPVQAQSAQLLLKVEGQQVLELANLQGLPRVSVKATPHHGPEGVYSGVLLNELLKKAGIPTGEALRGHALRLYLVAEAEDGYQAVFALAELDPAFNDRLIFVADQKDGQVLPAGAGPLQIIVPGEKRHARWVRQLKSLHIRQAPPHVEPTAKGNHDHK